MTIAFAALATVCASAAYAAGSGAPAEYDAMIAKHSRASGVPEQLIRRVIVRESKYDARAMHRGHYGMMQIKPATAKAMGYRGSAAGLLDADVNLTYGVRYLAGAWRVAGGDHDRAMRYYASGYYYDAKRMGMLAEIGMGRDGALSAPPAPASRLPQVASLAQPPSIPLPPVRDAASETVAQSAPAPVALTVPLPKPRDAATAPAEVAVPTAALASAVPTPRPRDDGPETTGSIAPKPRTISPATAPVLASSGLLPPLPQPRDVPAAERAETAVPQPASRTLAPLLRR